MQTDFIVIGSGLAGLTSSLILSKFGKVLLVTKGKLSDGATNWAQGGIACVVEKEDSWQKHYKDTLIAGTYHNDKKAVEFLVKNAHQAIDWLEKQGVPFEKANGKFKTGREGGHSFRRIIHATDFTGKVIEMTLVANVKKNRNIEIWEDAFAKRLLVEDGKCIGVEVTGPNNHENFAEVGKGFSAHLPNSPHPLRGVGSNTVGVLEKLASPQNSYSSISRHPLQTITCLARATILATGGLGQIYQWTTNPYVATGDGIAMAHRAGAKLKDMEFIQFHPTALKDGKSPLFLLSEALRGEGAWLVKRKALSVKRKEEGERFMGDYDKRMELAPRDIVARAIFNEQQKGYEVYLDIRHKGKKFLKARFPNIYKELERKGFDLAKDLIPVTCAAHYSCGGVEVDLKGRTNIKNLFAFGEVACTGVHGANRLASNSLLESVVFPLRLENYLSDVSSSIYSSSDPDLIGRVEKFRRNSSRQVYPERSRGTRTIKANLQQLMWEKVGIVRRHKELKDAVRQIIKLEKELEGIGELDIEMLGLRNMILTAKLVTQAALKREKSLGAHFIL